MVLLKEVNFNIPVFTAGNYVSEWINLESSSYVSYSVYSSNSCSVEINYSVDSLHQIIDTTTLALVGPSSVNISDNTKYKFAQYTVSGVPNPSDLKVQAFFFEKAALAEDGLVLSNIGGFAEVLKGTNEFRTIQSSDSSLTITENANDINLQVPAAIAPVKAYGRIFKTNSTVNINMTTSWNYLTIAKTLDSASNLFTNPSDWRLTYTGTETKTFFITFVLSGNSSAGEVGTRIRLNSTTISDSETSIGWRGYQITLSALVEMSTNDFVRPQYQRNASGSIPTMAIFTIIEA